MKSIPPPDRAALRRLLLEHAPLRAAPLCPEIQVHQADSLIGIWNAAERLGGGPLPAPFWAYAWPGGAGLARVILDDPSHVVGLRVLDFGAGGGVTSLAAARAGAAAVTANDIDPWALLVAQIAADAQDISLETLSDDVCANTDLLDAYDVVLCSDLAYERHETPRQRRVLQRALRAGKRVLVADAGRTYFDPAGMTLLAEYDVAVPHDLEGVAQRTARIYLMHGA